MPAFAGMTVKFPSHPHAGATPLDTAGRQIFEIDPPKKPDPLERRMFFRRPWGWGRVVNFPRGRVQWRKRLRQHVSYPQKRVSGRGATTTHWRAQVTLRRRRTRAGVVGSWCLAFARMTRVGRARPAPNARHASLRAESIRLPSSVSLDVARNRVDATARIV